ncbi:hypothetical protein OH76DRAFT_630651 [Lentinus brumalis]|uniref:Uncharacterized protein n=1 Tax=Lentinus brumalis TaxID=2498619 RepID=A0A371D8H8_9APHY|nr:hypothetical protein OH76DRAFT_630651 [Polyporus brumalis]
MHRQARVALVARKPPTNSSCQPRSIRDSCPRNLELPRLFLAAIIVLVASPDPTPTLRRHVRIMHRRLAAGRCVSFLQFPWFASGPLNALRPFSSHTGDVAAAPLDPQLSTGELSQRGFASRVSRPEKARTSIHPNASRSSPPSLKPFIVCLPPAFLTTISLARPRSRRVGTR